jgi:hypothetical protein
MIYATSQDYIDQYIVDAKIEAGDFAVQVSPIITVDGIEMQVVLDGHHSLEAAKQSGNKPVFVELTATEHDAIALSPADMLDAVWMGSDWRDAMTGEFVW